MLLRKMDAEPESGREVFQTVYLVILHIKQSDIHCYSET